MSNSVDIPNISHLVNKYEEINDVDILHSIIKYLLNIISKNEKVSNGNNKIEYDLFLSKLNSRNKTISKSNNEHSSYCSFNKNETTTLAINDFFDKDIEEYITNIKSSTLSVKERKKSKKKYLHTSRSPLKRNNSFNIQMRENSKRLKEMNTSVQSKIKSYIEKGYLMSKSSHNNSNTITSINNNSNIKVYVKKKVNGTLQKDMNRSSVNIGHLKNATTYHLNKSKSTSIPTGERKRNLSTNNSNTNLKKIKVNPKNIKNCEIINKRTKDLKKQEIANNGKIILRNNNQKRKMNNSSNKILKKVNSTSKITK